MGVIESYWEEERPKMCGLFSGTDFSFQHGQNVQDTHIVTYTTLFSTMYSRHLQPFPSLGDESRCAKAEMQGRFL